MLRFPIVNPDVPRRARAARLLSSHQGESALIAGSSRGREGNPPRQLDYLLGFTRRFLDGVENTLTSLIFPSESRVVITEHGLLICISFPP